MTLLISMVTKAGIFMIADSLRVEDTNKGVQPLFESVDKLDRVNNLNVVLSFWGTIFNKSTNFELSNELQKFKESLEDIDNVLSVAEKLKNYFQDLAALDDTDSLGFHVCGYIGENSHIHHVHHIPDFNSKYFGNYFRNEDSKREFCCRTRILDYPILFNGDNRIPNLFINMIHMFRDSIIYKDFDKEKAKRFLHYLMDTAIKLQDFSSRSLTEGNLIGYPLMFYEITRDDFRSEIIKKEHCS